MLGSSARYGGSSAPPAGAGTYTIAGSSRPHVSKPPPSIVSRTTGTGSDGGTEGSFGVGIGVSVAEGHGFWVNSVKVGGPAETAGLRKGELLVTIDAKRPRSLGHLRKLLLGPKGTKVDIGVRRPPNQSITTVTVTRGEGSMSSAPVLGIGMGFKKIHSGGFLVTNIHPDGPADRAGIQSGDVVCTFNGENVMNKIGNFISEALADNNEPIVRLGIKRGESSSLISATVTRTPLHVGSEPAETTPAGLNGSRDGGGGGGYSSAGGYSTAYDSDKSDYLSGSGGGYSSQRASFASDSSREGYSSDDSRGQPSPHTYVRQPLDAVGLGASSDGPGGMVSIRPVAKRQSGAGRGGERLGGVLLDDRRDRRRDDKHMLEPGALTSHWVELRSQAESMGRRLDQSLGDVHAVKRAQEVEGGGAGEAEERGGERRKDDGEEARRREAAEAGRQLLEAEAARKMEEVAALVDAVSAAEARRTEEENSRREAWAEKEERVDRLEKELMTMKEEQDGMLDGLEQLKRSFDAAIAKMEEKMKAQEKSVLQEFNSLKAQLFEAVAAKSQPDQAVEISTSTPAPIMTTATSRAPRTPGTPQGLVLEVDASPPHASLKGRSPPSPGAPRRSSGGIEHMPSQRGPPSPLVPRLGVRRCVTDEAVPANLRCATVVVGKRLLLFPKGKDGMCDLQFAMVMDCGSLRLWALRVMGALPLRCRCGFHVVGESVCVVPEDSAGRCELRQTLVLTAPEEDRIYSQGCFVEQDVPACTHADLRVVGRSCLIFPHDGEGAYDYDATCLLDTELLTLRAVGRAAAPVPAELAPPAQGRCQVAVAGWKAVLFPQTEARECVLAEAAVLDTNLGMLQQRVRLADPARPPPQAQSTLLAMGDKVYIFPHDNHKRYDFEDVWAVDAASGLLSAVPLTGAVPAKSKCHILVVAALFVIIPETEEGLALASMVVVDTAALPPLACAAFPLDLSALPLQDVESLPVVVGEHMFLLPRRRAASSAVVVISPGERKCQTYAVDIAAQGMQGFEVEVCDRDLIFIPYDSNGRRCVGDISILDSTLVR